jgi:ATP-dependent Lhr-like helicase
MLGLPAHGVESALTELLENQAIIEGKLTDAVAHTGTEICDAENYERLLRISRRAARPSFEALPPEALQLFLAWRQGLTRPGQGPEGLQERLEPLLGFPLSAALFEREFLPARCADYTTSALDVTFQESDLIWTGGGREKVILAFADQVELFFRDSTGEDRPENAESENAEPEPVSPARGDRFVPGRSYTFRELMSAFGGANTDTKTIWEAIWNGQIGAESAIGLRRAVLAGFKPLRDPRRTARGGRRGISRQERWRASDPYPGPWRRLAFPESSADALDELDLQKDRVRVLLDRYGVLFRELLARELPALRWGSVFRTLRLMELGGEVLAGHFFQGTSGLQFIAPEGLDALRKGLPEDAVYWVNATDPASVCGIVLEGLQRRPPARRATTHQVMIGSRTALVSTQMGRKLRFFISPDDPMLPRVLGIFHTWLNRSFDPMNVVVLERISGDPAPASPFLAAFRKEFNLSLEPNRVMLWRRYD